MTAGSAAGARAPRRLLFVPEKGRKNGGLTSGEKTCILVTSEIRRDTPVRMIDWIKKMWRIEIIRYLFAGGTAFVFDNLTFAVCNHFLPDLGKWWLLDSVRNMLSVMAGFLVGLLLNNLLSMFLVFTSESQKKKGRSARAFVMFSIVGVIGLLLSIGGNQLCIYLFGEGQAKELIYKIATAVPVTGWNYIGRKAFVSGK